MTTAPLTLPKLSLAALQATLESAATSTFEDLAFLSAGAAPEEGEALAPLTAAVRVAFRGPMQGHVDVLVGGDALPVLASNMVGSAAPPDEAVQHDALAELANVICGNTVPILAGWAAEFPLDAPTMLAPEAAPLGEVLAEARLYFMEGWALIRLARCADAPTAGALA